MHHVVSSGWSIGVFIRELADLYKAFSNDEPCPLPPLPIQYVDFAHWQREQLQGEELTQHLAYWKRKLDGALTILELPAHLSAQRSRHSAARSNRLLFRDG